MIRCAQFYIGRNSSPVKSGDCNGSQECSIKIENGEASFKDIAEAIHRELGFDGAVQTWTIEEAVQEWGQQAAHFAFGSNSRIRSDKARNVLGWIPSYSSVLDWLRT